MLVLFFNQIGTGYAAMQTFGSSLGSEVLHLKTFQQKQTRVSKAMGESADDILSQSVELIRRLHFDDSDILHNDKPIDIGVSFDGSWHTRGHNSKYGFASVIEITTGHVLDYEIFCIYCQNCTSYQNKYGVNSKQYKEWYQTHAQSRPINYTGSSNAMKMEGAKRIWSRSVEKNNMRYVRMLEDGDSKAYKAVLKLNPYNVDIKREECTNHAHKRMGTALRKFSKSSKMGGGGRGSGTLTMNKCQTLQNYYRGAIINNIGNKDNMRKAVWASLMHCLSIDLDTQHNNCPMSSDTWCFFNKALT